LARAVDRPEDDAGAPAAHVDLPDTAEARGRVEERGSRRLGEEDRAAKRLRQALDPRRGVDGVAVHGVLQPTQRAYVPGHERPAAEADSDGALLAEPVRPEPLVEASETDVDHVARGRERAIGMVLDLERRTERREEAVAPVRDERAAVLEDRVAR